MTEPSYIDLFYPERFISLEGNVVSDESGALRQSFPERLGRLVVGRCCVTNDISFDCFEETDAEPGPHHKGAHGCVCSELRCAF